LPDTLLPLRAAFSSLGPLVYFNHAACAPLARPVVEAIQGFVEEGARQGSIGFAGWLERRERARSAAARLLGAGADEVAFTTSTSQGLLTVAEGLSWRAGDRILVVEGDFPANLVPWYRQARRGVQVTALPRREGRVEAASILDAVDARTRLVAVPWVLYDNGYRLDLAALGAGLAARNRTAERPALLCVDAIQGLGAFPMDVERWGIDFLSADSHKWMLGLEGIGVFYCRRSALAELDSPFVSWWSHAEPFAPWTPDAALQPDARRFEYASMPTVGIYALHAALELLLAAGPERMEARILELTSALAEGLAERGWRLHSPLDSTSERSGIVAASHPALPAGAVVGRLAQAGISAAARAGTVRFSPHAWNTGDEVQTVLERLP
jgi:selenocysteine lyase/cysteine desulfurase